MLKQMSVVLALVVVVVLIVGCAAGPHGGRRESTTGDEQSVAQAPVVDESDMSVADKVAIARLVTTSNKADSQDLPAIARILNIGDSEYDPTLLELLVVRGGRIEGTYAQAIAQLSAGMSPEQIEREQRSSRIDELRDEVDQRTLELRHAELNLDRLQEHQEESDSE